MAEQTQKTVFLFYGADRYSLNQKLKFWQESFVKKYGDNSLEIIDSNKFDPNEFATNLEALPFLSEKRMVIIKDFLDNGNETEQKKIIKAIGNTPDFCLVIFHENEIPKKTNPLYKKIAKIGHLEEFKALSPNEITKWITDKAKTDNIKISFAAANYLSQQCGPELWTISNELEKLQLYADGKEISKDMIDELCVASLTSSVFKLTDEVAQKNIKASLKTFTILKNSGEDLIKIFFMLTRHFRIMTQVHEMIMKGERAPEITKRLKQHPFVIQKTSQQARNFTQEKFIKIYEEMLEIDTKIKTGIIKSYKGDNRELELAIEKFLINCCK